MRCGETWPVRGQCYSGVVRSTVVVPRCAGDSPVTPLTVPRLRQRGPHVTGYALTLDATVLAAHCRTLHSGAVEDFGVAIEVEPRYADSWKRRGQARSALGDHEGALADLQKAIDLAPLFGGPDSAQVGAHAPGGVGRGWDGLGRVGFGRGQRCGPYARWARVLATPSPR